MQLLHSKAVHGFEVLRMTAGEICSEEKPAGTNGCEEKHRSRLPYRRLDTPQQHSSLKKNRKGWRGLFRRFLGRKADEGKAVLRPTKVQQY